MFMCLISWERTQKGDPHKLFRGGFLGQKRGPKRAIFGHKKFSGSSFVPAISTRTQKSVLSMISIGDLDADIVPLTRVRAVPTPLLETQQSHG